MESALQICVGKFGEIPGLPVYSLKMYYQVSDLVNIVILGNFIHKTHR